jgi:hypothetical protein
MTNQLRKCSAATTRPDDEHLSSVLQVALSGLAWFLAVAWLDFSYDLKIHVAPAVVIGGSVMSLTLLLLTFSDRLQQNLVHGRHCAKPRD